MEITLLNNLLKKPNGEWLIQKISDAFDSKNKDVESFLKQKAIQSAKLSTSSTYLVRSMEHGADLLGYFTLALKTLTVKCSDLSATQQKTLRRFGSFDEESQSYKLPAILLAQFGRNFSKNSASISGKELMDSALECIKTVFSLSSGKTVFLECEPKEKLIQFYQNCGFSLLDNEICAKDKKQLIQLFRFV